MIFRQIFNRLVNLLQCDPMKCGLNAFTLPESVRQRLYSSEYQSKKVVTYRKLSDRSCTAAMIKKKDKLSSKIRYSKVYLYF